MKLWKRRTLITSEKWELERNACASAARQIKAMVRIKNDVMKLSGKMKEVISFR